MTDEILKRFDLTFDELKEYAKLKEEIFGTGLRKEMFVELDLDMPSHRRYNELSEKVMKLNAFLLGHSPFKVSEEFKVVAVSENTNSFGLRQVVLLARSGVVYKACKTDQFCPKKDQMVTIPVNDHGHYITHNFAAAGYELPERQKDAPKEIVDEMFKEEKS